MSKGIWRRPQQVSDETFAERWDAIFGTDKTQKGTDKTQNRRCSCGAEMVDEETIDGKPIKVCAKQREQMR